MGAWSVESFGNDDAGDWSYDLEGQEDLSFVEETLDRVLAGDYIEAPDGCQAIAAAEVIARLQGNWGLRDAYSEPVDIWVEKTKLKPDDALIQKAARAIDRVLGGQSELAELWQESEESGAWRENVLSLRARVV